MPPALLTDTSLFSVGTSNGLRHDDLSSAGKTSAHISDDAALWRHGCHWAATGGVEQQRPGPGDRTLPRFRARWVERRKTGRP